MPTVVDRGAIAADLSLDQIRQDHRRITLGFPGEIESRICEVNGVRRIQSDGRQTIVWTRHDADSVVELARGLNAVSIDVAPVTLLDLFLQTVTEAG